MNAESRAPWSKDIRRQVLQLITLLVSLVVIGAGYDVWSHRAIELGRQQLTDYHLASNFHYLHAMEDLRKLQSHHALRTAAGGRESSAEVDAIRLNDSQHLSKQHLLDQRIGKALQIEAVFAAPEFANLSKRLKQQMALLDGGLRDYRGGTADDEAVLAEIGQLLTTLEQLVRLHRIANDRDLAQLTDAHHSRDLLFYLLLSVLLALGLLVSWRSFGSINRIITRQVKAEEKIKFQAQYDDLTRLPNRSLALDRLSVMIEEASRDGKQVAVLFIDLDFFKKVNDMLGHTNGDRLLVEAAQRLRRTLRAADTVGRLGGDEFIVLVGGLNQSSEVNAIAENLIEQVRRPFVIGGREIVLSASIGISVYPHDGREKYELIRKADTAMYHSKQRGRNASSFFTDSMNRDISRKLSIEGQMHGALDRGEFEVHYQQKVDIPSGRAIGAEALLRWHNPELGQVPPDEFIPVAEQTGLIVPIGEFVLEQALARAHDWQRELDSEFRVAVNLSPRQFRDPHLVDKISRCLHHAGVTSRSLELEITEGVLMSDYLHIDELLAEFTRLGVTIAMDDFGTGYSSLSYLRNYPFDVIKIDRSFIRDIDTNALSEQLNHAAVSMAHALDIQVVAEGVESGTQLEVLRKLNCDIAQGYYFGKPIPAEGMTELLRGESETAKGSRVVDIPRRRDNSPKAS